MGFVIRRFSSGELIDKKYLLMGSVGRGASGEVFRARNLLAGNILALKLLVEEQQGDNATVQRFFREARAINRVGHPNIVQVFDAGFAESTPYIAMEFLSGESLARLLDRKRRLDLASAVAILAGVLDALSAAHKVNIIHRDLKPANVFLAVAPGKPVVVKLLDFGVAKMRELGEESLRTSSGLILGTPDYLSPEQVTADTELDGRSDLFAAGVLLFELLTGRRPFASPTFVTTTYRIVHESPPLVSELGGPEDPSVLTVLERALAKQREARYATAEEFAADLRALVPDEAARERALQALEIIAPTRDEPWEFTPPVLPATTGIPAVESDEDAGRTPRKGSTSGHAKPAGEKTPSGSAKVRTWTDLPIVGRRKTGKEPARHVRGTVLRAMDRAITTRYGADVREDLLRALPKKLREALVLQELHPDSWYSLDALTEFVERGNTQVVHGEADKWRALGYACVETDLLTLVRSTRRQTDLMQVLRTTVPICADLFDFGSWRAEDEGAPRVVIEQFAALPASVLDWLAGVIEHAARSTGKSYRVTVGTTGTLPDDPRVEFQIDLR